MGNQIEKGNGENSNKSGTFTPKKSPSKLFSSIFSNDKQQKSKSAHKEALYAEEKPFENFESNFYFNNFL